MTRITVVIEDHGEGIHLGQQLAGGRVVAAMQGDHSELLDGLQAIADRTADDSARNCALTAIAKARSQ